MNHAVVLLFQICVLISLQNIQVSEGCIGSYSNCNDLYLPDCCPKIYSKDGKDFEGNIGYYCNMQDPKVGYYPFDIGCCQRCWSLGDGCAEGPCCPGFLPAANKSCASGNECIRDSNSSAEVKKASCYTEGMACDGDYWECCQGTTCKIDSGESFGKCEKIPGYTGPVPDPPKPPKLPLEPLAPRCPYYKPPPTTEAPKETTTEAPKETTTEAAKETTTEAAKETTTGKSEETTTSTIKETTSSKNIECPLPTSATPKTDDTSSCKLEGDYCDGQICCDSLQCPNNWWPLWILRWLLNWIGLWYRVCRNYGPLVWYNPFSWYDY